MGTTTNYNLPYPDPGDPVAGIDGDMTDLANAIDDALWERLPQCGTITVSLVAEAQESGPVSFYVGKFALPPKVVATPRNTTVFIATVSAVTTDGCNVSVRHNAGTSVTEDVLVDWIACAEL